MDFFNKRREPPHSYDVLAASSQLKEMLARQVSPILEGEGYRYDSSYQWIGSWENHSRRIVRVRLLKGASGEFAWGRCFDFIPVPQNDGRSCRWQRTDKSAGLQLFVWTGDLLSGAETEWQTYRFSLFGADLNDVERRLGRVFHRSKPLGDAWFRTVESPEQISDEAVRQCQKKNYHWPAPVYIRAFLLSALGRPEEGLQVLDAWLAQKELRISAALCEKLHQKLWECADCMIQ